MGNVALMFLNVRRFFGFLLPGLSWTILLYLLWQTQIDHWLNEHPRITDDRVILYVIILVVSYVIGVVNIQISFRILNLLGDGIDHLVSRRARGRARSLFSFLSRRFHIFNLETRQALVNRLFNHLSFSAVGQDLSAVEKKELCKMKVMDRSPGLAKALLDIEGEINFYAGMFVPILILGCWFLTVSLGAGIVALFIGLWFILRLQHERHDEADVTAWAYAISDSGPRRE